MCNYIFTFIYQVDYELFNDTNFICNYLIHKQINKDNISIELNKSKL